MIHATAIIDPQARLADDVSVGPWSIVGAGVEIGSGSRIGSHVVLEGPMRIGRDNRIFQHCSLGGDPQDKKYAGEASLLEIGDRNVIREFCTFNRGTGPGGGVTRIGDGNWVMAYVHVAHDCRVGSDSIMANGTTLAGHVVVGDFVTFGAFTIVHQFCAIGAHSFTAMGTVVLKDLPPFVMASGNPAHPHGLNREGLRRRDFDPDTVLRLKRAYRTVYREGLTVEQALDRLAVDADECEQVASLCEFLRRSSRGIVR